MALNNFRRFSSALFSKALIMATACALILGSISGGTVAWLLSKSNPVRNTFTYGEIGLVITETDTGLDDDGNPDTNTYMMMPDASIDKDPRITFLANSENAWLFVKLDKSENFDTFLTCEIADGWTALEGVEGVYWRMADQAEEDQIFDILQGNQVHVRPEVTAAMLNALNDATLPTLSFTAWAVQRIGVADAAAAWNIVDTQPLIVP